MTSFDFAMKLLQEGDVVVSPGAGFGPAGEGYVRMALVENESRLRQAVRQIGRCLKKEKGLGLELGIRTTECHEFDCCNDRCPFDL